MRVRFSPEIFRLERFGGVSRYITRLDARLRGMGVDSRIVAPLHRSSLLGDSGFGLDVDQLRPVPLRQAITRAAGLLVDATYAAAGPSTVYHASYFEPFVPSRPTTVVTVYDMIHELYPEQVGPRDRSTERKRLWCRRADVVLAISESTRQDLIDRFGLAADRVRVTHLGVDAVVPFEERLVEGPYVLYVGQRRKAYKNFGGALEALARSGLDPSLRLVCAGGGSFTDGELERMRSLGLERRCVQTSVDDRALAALYRDALALVYPSFYEGFGLPPLEAMAHGCPVAAARAGSIPEVVGAAAELFDPADPDDIAKVITRVVTDAGVRSRLVAEGARQARAFTWDATARATLDAYQAAAI